jgi:hypothetical protein
MVGRGRAALLVVAAAVCPGASPGEPPYAVTEAREPCAAHDPQRNLYFGDLHVHTTFSQDASTQGTRNTPRDAYRFARGERIGLQPYDDRGRPLRSLQIGRPLDFAAVTDHAEMLGETEICKTPGLPGHGSWVCRMYRRFPRLAFFVMNAKTSMSHESRFGFCGPGGVSCLEAARTPWQELRDAAEAAYDRSAACSFTTFVGYEWTASKQTNNLHRNVIFRNERVPDLPTSVYEAGTAEALWRALRKHCVDGCDALVIPHNSNISNGLIFRTVRSDGTAITVEDARTRAGAERLVEVMQHKGDSECRVGAGTTDELCGFEKLSFGNFMQKFVPVLREAPDPRSFTRNALLEGLIQQQRLGANPFQFGLIASTDTHLGTPGAVEEDQYPGHGGAGAPAGRELPKGLPDDLEFNPGGLAAVWAEENSRDAIFAALRRREVYGTSGPRIAVRFFGGWSVPANLCQSRSFVETGYAEGVPMGGELDPGEAKGDAPRFAVSALRDPGTATRIGTPLQRVQIIKGWIEDGQAREAVYEIAGDPENGASVDLDTCAPRGPGSDALCSVWSDPDFDPGAPAFYYARVVENPTCRWSTRVCNAHAVDCSWPDSVPSELAACCDPSHRRTIQERAWTSPIWYTPELVPGAAERAS